METDHKPLESIFLKPLSEAPPRLQRMLLRLQQYNLIVKYKKGKELYVADTLSRAQLPVCEQTDEEIGIHLVTNLNIQESSIERFRSHTQTDPVLQKLQATIMKGWPNEKSKVEPEILDYWFHRETLSCADGLVFKSNRLVVPKTLRREILAEVHGAHMGEEKTLRLARDYVFWPRMSSQIKDLVASCPTCNCFRKNQQQEPLLQHEVPSGPWKKVGIDLFSCLGDDYCLFTEYFSTFFEINKLQTLTAMEIIEKSQQQFVRYGIPDHVISDNGTQFNSYEFKEFAADWKFSHTTSSPEYAQSNGMVERYIQICKGIIKKAHKEGKNPYLALLKYRNTPVQEGIGSPAQLLMGRRTRTTIPTCQALLQPQLPDLQKVKKILEERQKKEKQVFDKHAKPLPELKGGDTVRFKPKHHQEWKKAVVLPRSYVVLDEQGKMYRRNRRHLVKTAEPTPIPVPELDAEIPVNLENQKEPEVDSTPVGQEEEDYQPMRKSYQTRVGRVPRVPRRFLEETT